MKLTQKQVNVLAAIAEYRREHGYSPTMQNLADTLGVSKVTIFEHLGVLDRKGLIRRDRHKARSLEIVTTDLLPPRRLPVLQVLGYIGWFKNPAQELEWMTTHGRV